jgi:hypothetical protein
VHPSQLLPRRRLSFRSTTRAACVVTDSGICAADSRVREVAVGVRAPDVAARSVATRLPSVSLRLSRVAASSYSTCSGCDRCLRFRDRIVVHDVLRNILTRDRFQASLEEDRGIIGRDRSNRLVERLSLRDHSVSATERFPKVRETTVV